MCHGEVIFVTNMKKAQQENTTSNKLYIEYLILDDMNTHELLTTRYNRLSIILDN